MNIKPSKQKRSKKKAAPKARLTPEEKFDRIWQRVTRQQKENIKFEQDLRNLAEQVKEQIKDPELARAQACYNSCQHLLTFIDYKSLTVNQRGQLLALCEEYLREIAANPFASNLDLNPILECFQEAIETHFPDPHEEFEDDEDLLDRSTDSENQTDDMFEELFAEFTDENEDDDLYSSFQDEAFERFFNEQVRQEKQREEDDRALSQMLKSSSVNKLFRKIARVIHPDREQDETLKTEKNRQMSELIEAREQNDIPRIFGLYAEHVGESPTSEIADDLDTVTAMLERQSKNLEQDKYRFLDKEPFLSVVNDRFNRRSKKNRQDAMDEYLDYLENITYEEEQLIIELRTLKNVKEMLKQRFSRRALFADIF